MKKLRKDIGKRIAAVLLVMLGFIFYQESVLAQTQTSVNVSEATSIANQYMQALINGDINTMRSLLAEKLLKRKANIFSNPDYPQFLKKLYKNAKYEIVNSAGKGKKMTAVDVMITYPNKGISRFRLWIKDSNNAGLHVFMETNLNR